MCIMSATAFYDLSLCFLFILSVSLLYSTSTVYLVDASQKSTLLGKSWSSYWLFFFWMMLYVVHSFPPGVLGCNIK